MPRKSKNNFKPGDLVFAKMKGFPHWPARICKSEDGYKKRVPVYFFGTHQLGQIPPKNVVPYAGNKNKFGSGVRIKGFTEGMWEIQNTPGIGSKLRVPAKTTPVKPTPKKMTNDKFKSIPTSQTAPTTADSKSGSGRSTPSKVTTETEAADKTPSRASLRSALEREAKETPEKCLTPEDVTATDDSEVSGTRRGAASSKQAAPAGRRTRQTTTSISSARSEKEADAEQHKKTPASPEATPASKKHRITETRAASRQTSQNDNEQDEEEKGGTRVSESWRVKRRREKPTGETKVEEEEKPEGMKRKKAKKDIDEEGKAKERTKEKSAETRVMKTRGAEKEEEKEEKKKAKQDGRKRKRGERTASVESQRSKRKSDEKDTLKKKKRGGGAEGKEQEQTGEKLVRRGGKTRRAEKGQQMEKRAKDTGEAAKKMKKDERDGKSSEEEEVGDGSVEEQRQHQLASKRESVLKSLRGLLKHGRGRKRTVASLKASDRAKRSVMVRKTSGKNSVKESTVAQVISKKANVKPFLKKNLSGKFPEDSDKVFGQTPAEKSKGEQKTPSKTGDEGKEKNSRQQNDDKMKDEGTNRGDGKNSDETNRHEEKKEERKIIGKIVKATAKQGTKVKTMMGGLMVPAAEDEKKIKEKKTDNVKETNREKTPGDRSTEKSTDAERKGERTRAAMDDKKDGGDPTTARRREDEPKVLKSSVKSQEKSSVKESQDKREKKSERTASERGETSAESHPKDGDEVEKTSTATAMKSDSPHDEQVEPEAKKEKRPTMTLTDSTLHRIHGDIRISLKSDNPDIGKCLKALDQLSMVYVTSQHVQRHSELVATLRKMRFYRANQAVMDKASMLYNRFKNAFLLGQGEEVVSAAFLRSLLQEKEREEESKEQLRRDEGLQEVRDGSDGGSRAPEAGGKVALTPPDGSD